jgi:hypothetical protein
MVIYATEFVLWCGVFACGGYFNLAPWIGQKIKSRRERTEETSIGLAPEENTDGEVIANDVSLNLVPSSTSVFRTPSSVLNSRVSHNSARNED